MWADRAVEVGPRRARGARLERLGGHVAGDASAQPAEALGQGRDAGDGGRPREVGHVGQHSGHGPERAHGLAGEAHHAASEHLEVAGHALAVVLVLGRVDLAPLGAGVEDGGEDLVPGDAVDGGVVHLVEQRHAPVLEPLDHVQLPQRPGAVQRPGVQARDGLAQLGLGARGRDGRLAHVEIEVEVRVLDPVGLVEPERDVDQLPAEGRKQMQPLGEHPADVLRAQVAARRGGRVVDGQAGHVAVGPRVLYGQELRVEARQLLHPAPLLMRVTFPHRRRPQRCDGREASRRGPSPRGPCAP